LVVDDVDDAVELGVLLADDAVELGVLPVDEAVERGVLALDDVVLAWFLCIMLSHVAHPASAMIARAIAVLRKPVDSMNSPFRFAVDRPMRSRCRAGAAEIASRPLRQGERYESASGVGTSRWPMLM